ncbi:hypothetical protein P3T35_002482 [Kitasatospora sp. GP30]|uniref:hypothetical protein n=1 Tax=Kitasatospora sp. GP30 TaxID=3035084 RepID=UPI000C700F2F|nr:hypothetical protein [Kitasatospora sp. GP30]MDH6140474.1 hypothetical protein [Kitasatospora sp. GP30]
MAEKPGADFQHIQQRAACAFATRARIEAAPPFRGADARIAGLAAASTLADLASRADADELDGLLIELTDARHGLSLGALAATTREILAGLLEADGDAAAETLSNAGVDHWWLTLCGTRWFALAFAPCYPADSPRFTFGSGSTFLLLQPVASFDRHATPRGSVIADEVRQMIRRAYAARGCPYDVDLAQQDVEALKFVWPLHQGDAPVQWWRSGTAVRRESA